jgi:hypothetical protein
VIQAQSSESERKNRARLAMTESISPCKGDNRRLLRDSTKSDFRSNYRKIRVLSGTVVLAIVCAAFFFACVSAGGATPNWTLYNLTRTPDQREGEPVVAINPAAPLDAFVALVQNPRVDQQSLEGYRTSDGGETWSIVGLGTGGNVSTGGGNPSIVATRTGRFYLAYDTTQQGRPTCTVILVSNDSGATWSKAWSLSGPFLDQPDLAVSEPDASGRSALWLVGSSGKSLQAFMAPITSDATALPMREISLGDITGVSLAATFNNQVKVAARGLDNAKINYQSYKLSTGNRANADSLWLLSVTKASSRADVSEPRRIAPSN